MTDYARLDLGEVKPGRYLWLAIGKYKNGTYWLQQATSHESGVYRKFGERVKFERFSELLDYIGRVYGFSAVSKLRYLLHCYGYRKKWGAELPVLERWIRGHLEVKPTPSRLHQTTLQRLEDEGKVGNP